MIRRYDAIEFVNIETGEVIRGARMFRIMHGGDITKIVSTEKWSSDLKTRGMVIGVVIKERRNFKIIAEQAKLKLF